MKSFIFCCCFVVFSHKLWPAQPGARILEVIKWTIFFPFPLASFLLLLRLATWNERCAEYNEPNQNSTAPPGNAGKQRLQVFSRPAGVLIFYELFCSINFAVLWRQITITSRATMTAQRTRRDKCKNPYVHCNFDFSVSASVQYSKITKHEPRPRAMYNFIAFALISRFQLNKNV